MNARHTPRPALLDLVENLGRLVAGERRRHAVAAGLQPVHMQALAYLQRCNRYSNTPQALADFLGLTKGTVSQSLQLLERKGLIARLPDADDGRVVRLTLTAVGMALASESEAYAEWSAALAELPAAEAEAAAATLTRLLGGMQQRRGGQSFGACHSCRHFRHEGETAYRCGLTGEALDRDDSRRLCREHAWPETVATD